MALGGANYRRNVAMLDDDGKEVPGTKGYKYAFPFSVVSLGIVNSFSPNRYFGRAKDLPGVRELFQSRKKEDEEESATFSHYKKFMNQGPEYYGSLNENGDDDDDGLLKFEREEEENG